MYGLHLSFHLFYCNELLHTRNYPYVGKERGPHPLYRAGLAELAVVEPRLGFHTTGPNRRALSQYACDRVSYGRSSPDHQSQGPGV